MRQPQDLRLLDLRTDCVTFEQRLIKTDGTKDEVDDKRNIALFVVRRSILDVLVIGRASWLEKTLPLPCGKSGRRRPTRHRQRCRGACGTGSRRSKEDVPQHWICSPFIWGDESGGHERMGVGTAGAADSNDE